MEDEGVPRELLSLFKRWYKNVTVRIKVNDAESDWIELKIRVK
jgi:hypothetical protein